MKAWVLHDVNDLRMEEVEEPALAEDEVLVAVKAAGICGSDIPRVYRTGTYSYPLIIGHEFSGEVVRLGTRADSEWLHRRVGVFPLIPCRECGPCRKGQYEMCRHYSYLGSRRNGGFAEYAAVPVWNLVPLPEQVTYEEAAMLEPMAVAAHAMRRISPSVSDTAAVCGLGTIGQLLVMFLREAGIRKIYTIGNKESQKQAVLHTGVQEVCYCDSREQDSVQWLMEHTEGMGADLFFECTGQNEIWDMAIRGTAPAGHIMLVGNPIRDMNLKKDVYWKILRNQLTVAGTWNSSFTHSEEDDWHYVLRRLAQKTIAPAELITHRFPLGELEKGFRIMETRSEESIKIMGIL